MRHDDAHFINLLNRVRVGEESDEDHLSLQQHVAPKSDVSPAGGGGIASDHTPTPSHSRTTFMVGGGQDSFPDIYGIK